MSKYSFGDRSSFELSTCDERLQRVAKRALDYGVMDFSVIDGRRTTDEQIKLHRAGKSKLDGVNRKSKHQADPPDLSRAMDLMPYPGEVNGVSVWKDKQRFSVLAGLVMAAAAEEGVALRWGGDWDGDGNNADSSFHDMPHFELL